MRFFISVFSFVSLLTPILAAPIENANIKERDSNNALTKVQLPASTLPAPPAGLVLKWIGLGIGTQNYTCASSDASVVPASNGALATLYDISSLNNDKEAASKIRTITAQALGASNFGQKSLTAYLNTMGYNKLLGNHFFNQTLVPTFHLSALKNPVPAPELFGKKVGDIPAPVSSCKGTTGEGAVDWLFLEDIGNSIGGVKAVYRVETAGGMAPANCAGQAATINVPYSAEYWFYGSP